MIEKTTCSGETAPDAAHVQVLAPHRAAQPVQVVVTEVQLLRDVLRVVPPVPVLALVLQLHRDALRVVPPVPVLALVLQLHQDALRVVPPATTVVIMIVRVIANPVAPTHVLQLVPMDVLRDVKEDVILLAMELATFHALILVIQHVKLVV